MGLFKILTGLSSTELLEVANGNTIDLKKVDNLLEDGKYDEVIKECSKHIHDKVKICAYGSYSDRAIAYLGKAVESEENEDKYGYLKNALRDLEEAYKLIKNDDSFDYGEYFYWKAIVLKELVSFVDNPYDGYKLRMEARNHLIKAMGCDSYHSEAKEEYESLNHGLMYCFNAHLTIDQENIEYGRQLKEEGKSDEEIEKELQQQVELAERFKFPNIIPWGYRQFIFFVKNEDKLAGCYDEDDIINVVFTLDQYPSELTFPVGHPQANTLYLAHPARKGFYLPFDGAEDVIFHEKIDEFCHLARCLGATEISFNSIKGELVSESFSSHLNIDGKCDIKVNKIKGDYSNSNSGSNSSERHREEGFSYTLQPKQAYVPSDLRWLDIDESWKSFVKQRMEGNIRNYTKRISSSEAASVSRSLQSSAKASFENLMLNVDGSFNIEQDSTFSHNQNSEWEINIQFASLDDLKVNNQEGAIGQIELNSDAPQTALTEAENKYKEEILFILEDGSITETERKFLERKRVKLGLTIERAAEIEAMCVPSLTEDEKEYLEIYKEFIEDGPITDRKRKMLSREAESLGISPERVEELEKQV